MSLARLGARSFLRLNFDKKSQRHEGMDGKIETLRRLMQQLKEKYGKDGEVKIEVLNEIFDCGAWFGVEALTETMEKRAAARENEQIDRTKLS